MALPLPAGLVPSEMVFLCEMELITVIPRQKLEGLELLGGSIPPLRPPLRSDVPLWLALLLKKQRRANIVPPPWLDSESLTLVLQIENEQEKEAFSTGPPLPRVGSGADAISPPFVPSSTVDSRTRALPYHWMEMGEILLEAAADDIRDADKVRGLLRDLREARLAKLRAGIEVLDAAGGVQMNGVGGIEVAEGRAFICGVIDGLRKIGASREMARRGEEENDDYQQSQQDDDDEDMLQ